MNWLSGTPWLWKALRGQSVTFAALFALSILGLSVVRAFRHLLSALGAPWLLLFLVPALAIGAIARRESEWMPEEEQRKRWSRRLVFGAIGLSVLLALLAPKRSPEPVDERPADDSPVRIHRPSGK